MFKLEWCRNGVDVKTYRYVPQPIFIYIVPVVYFVIQVGNFKKLVFRPLEELQHYFPKSRYATS